MNKGQGILSKDYLVNELYTVTFFLKKGSYAESYRVKDQSGKVRVLKLFILSKLHRSQYDKDGEVLEIKILKNIDHINLVKYYDSGEFYFSGQKLAFVVLEFISGETLADKLKREELFNPYEVKDIISGVLEGLNYLHTQDPPVIHNDITNLNVMLDLSGSIAVPKVIDFGYARYLNQSNKEFLNVGLNPFYQANETFNKVFSVQSDLFSIGALYYHLLEGLPPWFIELSKFRSDAEKLEDAIIEERSRPLKFSTVQDFKTQQIIRMALQPMAESRFQNAHSFIQALNGQLEVSIPLSQGESTKSIPKSVKKGKGFSAIAGMKNLKEIIQLDVIDALNNQERYAEYGLTIPNGMLLYGPPGCGKTFFAERLAEEIGFNFFQLKPSDIQSKYVNESQERIKNIFSEARQNAPCIIFMDELDAVVPDRNNSNVNHMNTSAVNELLAQMNNSGEDGVFIIGATNRPNSIDPAILRAGRLDKIIFLPPPDQDAREEMFRLYLEKRPVEIGLDYLGLAKATENYVSSDIKFLCDEASRMALKSDSRITKELLMKTIENNKPSISMEELDSYTDIKSKMEGLTNQQNERPSIGFKKY